MDVFHPGPMIVNSAAWITGVIVGILIGWFAHTLFHNCKK